MRDSHPWATMGNALFLTRNEQVSGSNPLVGSFILWRFARNPGRQRGLGTKPSLTYDNPPRHPLFSGGEDVPDEPLRENVRRL
jgi:hypothetical protein